MVVLGQPGNFVCCCTLGISDQLVLHCAAFKICKTPPKTKMTMEKQPFEDVYIPLKIVIFHCCVSFREGIFGEKSKLMQNLC